MMLALWKPDLANSPILPGPLRLRLALPFVALLILTMALLSWTTGLRVREAYLDRMTEQVFAQAEILAVEIGDRHVNGADQGELQEFVASMSAVSPTRLTVIDADGTVLADSQADPNTMTNHADRPEVIQALESGEGTSTRRSATLSEEFLYAAVAVPNGDGMVVRSAVPLAEVTGTVRSIWGWTAMAGVIASLTVVAIAWFIAGRIVQPLEELRQHAIRVARGDLTARIRPLDDEEFAEVGFAMNRMTEEIQSSHAALEEARLRLEAVLAELADGVVITSETGNVLRMNTAAQHLLGVDEKDAIGRAFLQVCRDHELNQLLQSALDELKHSEGTIEHGLNRRTLLTTAQVVENAHERLGLVVLRDISELRRLESVRREFVANVSHELRTPLTSIRAMVETLEAGAIEDEAITTDFLARIVSEVDRLNMLVEDLLDLARLEAGRTKLNYDREDPATLVQEGVDRMATQLERAQLEIEVLAAADMKPIQVDKARVEQVLINLLHNAIKFTPAGGRIIVTVQQGIKETSIEVEDTGVGIAPIDQIRLFERFYKSDKARRSEGTGLGLAIAKHIVQAHGGTITVRSVVGEGSAFRFTLPNRRPSQAGRKRLRARDGAALS